MPSWRTGSRSRTIPPAAPPDALSAELKARIRAIATEANRGADRALIEALPKLEVIGVFGVGTDAVDLAAARERNIPVTNTPGYHGRRGAPTSPSA